MKKIILILSIFAANSASASVKIDSVQYVPDKIAFAEIWAYLMRGEEKHIKGAEPFTDIAYFSLWINTKGELSDPVPRPKIKINNKLPKIHIVISELSGKTLTSQILEKNSEKRETLIKNIIEASADFDGVQIDFEHVSPNDKDNFISFLAELKSNLSPEKVFSVALPAKRFETKDDPYDYSLISRIADRIVIMAYDQHWSKSQPGPVAGYEWCNSVMSYSVTAIPKNKLIMGLPLYGREWIRKKSRAVKYNEIFALLSSKKTKFTNGKNPFLVHKLSKKSSKIIYFDNTYSIGEKIKLYKSENIRHISFWRIGQGPDEIWKRLESKRAAEVNFRLFHEAVKSFLSINKTQNGKNTSVRTDTSRSPSAVQNKTLN